MRVCVGAAAGVVVAGLAWGFDPVAQTARDIPVIRDADVVVVGGGSAAVSAAIAAKTNGASVFLVAPRTYLGDDLAATRELWPAPAEEFLTEPLAQQVFTMKVPFTYTASLTPNAAHADPGNTRLTDGVKYDAAANSVQYDNTVQITLAFAGAGTVTQLDVYYYYRPTSNPFDTIVSAVEFSSDGVNWSSSAISPAVESLGLVGDITTYVAKVALGAGVQARYLRVSCVRGPGAVRQLLDEIVVHTSLSDPVPAPVTRATLVFTEFIMVFRASKKHHLILI